MSGLNKTLILASASPRRRELLHEAGYDFVVRPSDLDESEVESGGASPTELAELLSVTKAKAVAADQANAIVMGADTIVAANNVVFGKPEDAEDARRILGHLMHTPHKVITGVTLLDADNGQTLTASDTTAVTMTPMTDDELDRYIESKLWEGKAGAYGIQDHDDQFIACTEGSFTNVMGLPMELTQRMLGQWGIEPIRS